MKFYAWMQQTHKFTARLYKFNTITDSTGGNTLSYFYDRDIVLDALTDGYGKIKLYFQDSYGDITSDMLLYDLLDPTGVELLPNAVHKITTILPIINLYGEREGFSGSAVLWGYDGIAS
jgi:hypothetical protein